MLLQLMTTSIKAPNLESVIADCLEFEIKHRLHLENRTLIIALFIVCFWFLSVDLCELITQL